MRFVSIILLLSLFLYAVAHKGELKFPKCIEYSNYKQVVENDWTCADKHIKKFIDHNATNYVNAFMELVTQPLILETDKEYIEDQLKRHRKYLKWNLTKGGDIPFENMHDYKKRLHKEIKYHIYNFDRYKNTIDATAYRGVYLYIKYLEHVHQYNQIFELYDAIATRLLDVYTIQDKTLINIMILNIKTDEYIRALSGSLKKNYFSEKQKQMLYNTLVMFLSDKKLFSKMLTSEKQELYKYLNMFYLDKNATTNTIIKDPFFKGMLKIIEEENLKKHLRNRKVMRKIVDNFKADSEQIHDKLLLIKTREEYKAYVDKKESFTEAFDYLDMPRLYILYMTDDLGFKRFSHIFKYSFSSSEFIKFIRKPHILYSKPWILGKYKFKYEERLEKNKKLLDSLKN